MTDIKRLMNKYYSTDGKNMTGTPKRNKYEQTSKEYNKRQRTEYNLKLRQSILSEILNEIPFHITEIQTQQIRYWITMFNEDFKNFHRQSSNETILLAFIFIQQKQVNKRINVEQYSISKKYNLTTPIFETTQNELIFQLMRTTPLQYNQKKVLDNSILQKGKRE